MKTLSFAYILVALIASCGEESAVEEISSSTSTTLEDTVQTESDPVFEVHQNIDTFQLGDMNFDGIEDTAIVFSPFHAYPSPDNSITGGCEDDSCLTKIKFNFTESELEHTGALGFQSLFATDDLNSDGIKELGFIPKWFQSCWQGLFVYSFEKSQWKQIGSGSVYACSDENFSERVKKIDSDRFMVNSMRWNEDGGEIIDTSLFFPL